MRKNNVLAAIAAAAVAVSAAQAQPPPPWAGRPGQGMPPGRLPGAGLTPEEASKLKAAEAKAMESEEVRKARERFVEAERALGEARRNAILQADPGLAAVLDKMEKAREGMKQRTETARGLNLSPDEREKLKKAWAQVKDDPAVKAAREKMRGPGVDRRAALKELADASRSAALKADPSLEPILKKMGPSMKDRFLGAEAGRRPQFNAQMGPPKGPPPGLGHGQSARNSGSPRWDQQWRGRRWSPGPQVPQGPGAFQGPEPSGPPQGPRAFFNQPMQRPGPWAQAPGWRRSPNAGLNPQGGWCPPTPQRRGPAWSQPRGFPRGMGPGRGRWSM